MINMNYFNELKRRIGSAGFEELVSIKKTILEELESLGFKASSGENSSGSMYLFLDALCDLRLGAHNWTDEGDIVVVSRNDMDFLADWYERAAAAARSINQRQEDGRGGCNGAKAVALREFFLPNREKIEGLVSSGCKYAVYLNERTQQILQMEKSKEWAKVEKVDCLRGKYL